MYISQPEAQRQFLHSWSRKWRRRFQCSAGKVTRCHRAVYTTTGWFVNHTDHEEMITNFTLHRHSTRVLSLYELIFLFCPGENEDEKLNEVMYEAWRFNRDCKLLRDGLQALSWDGQYSFVSCLSPSITVRAERTHRNDLLLSVQQLLFPYFNSVIKILIIWSFCFNFLPNKIYQEADKTKCYIVARINWDQSINSDDTIWVSPIWVISFK